VPCMTFTTLGVPERKWDSIPMDFFMGLPKTRSKNNAIWVIVDRLTKYAHFIAMTNTWTQDQLGRACLNEIVLLHRVTGSIVSD